jgi:hypothetical protein
MIRTFRGLTMIGLVLLLGANAFAQGKGNGGGKGGGDNGGGGEDPPVTLPAVRYQINRMDFPADSYTYINDVNDLGEVVGWISFIQADGTTGPRHAYVANPAMSEFTLLESIVDTSNLPADAWLASAVGINDHGVVVGYTLNDADERYPFAVDLALDSPVVDLLPRTGFVDDYARRINNRGEIVGVFSNPLDPETTEDDYVSMWYLDPLLYGDPATRIPRDVDEFGNPVAVDLSHLSPVSLESILGPTLTGALISNPSDNGPTFIGGNSAIDQAPFRLNISTMTAEFLTDFIPDGSIVGIDASGAVAGRGLEPGKGKKLTTYGYRYSSALEVLPEPTPTATGRVGEVLLGDGITGAFALYRDWQDGLGSRSVPLDDLVIGSSEDLDAWYTSEFGVTQMASGGTIALKMGGGAVDELVTLFEVPSP